MGIEKSELDQCIYKRFFVEDAVLKGLIIYRKRHWKLRDVLPDYNSISWCLKLNWYRNYFSGKYVCKDALQPVRDKYDYI